MKNVILFDFFGVLCSEIAPFWFRRHFTDTEADAIKAEIVSKGDIGLISEEEMYRQISARTGIAPEQIGRDWMDLVKINAPLTEFVRILREKHRVYLLSNAIGPFLRRILEENGLYSLFDGIIISSEIGLIKPDVAFFEKAVELLNVDPADAVMIDDNPHNIAGATQSGIKGLVFMDNEQLWAAWDDLVG